MTNSLHMHYFLRKIKVFFAQILRMVGCVTGVFINVETIHKMRRFYNFIYSGMIMRSFGSVGSNFYIESPANIHGAEYMTIGDNFSSFQRLRLEAFSKHNGVCFDPEIVIGDNVSINFDCHIAAINKISIGNNVLIASKVYISDHFHGAVSKEDLQISPSSRQLKSKGAVVIEDDVWIGEGAVILPNVRIGKGSVVGANAVVTRNFPPYSIVAGVPAVQIKTI